MGSMLTRLRRLEAGRGAGGECRVGPTIVIDAGEPVPSDAQRCRLCGCVHVLELDEEVVSADGDPE